MRFLEKYHFWLLMMPCLLLCGGEAAGKGDSDKIELKTEEYCAKTNIDGTETPIKDLKVKGRFGDVISTLQAPPDQAWLERGRKDPFYRIQTVPFERVSFPDGRIEILPALDEQPRDNGFICDESSKDLNNFLACLENTSVSYRLASRNKKLKNNFIWALGTLNQNYLLKNPASAHRALEGDKFLSDLDLSRAGTETLKNMQNKVDAIKALRSACTVPGCAEAVDKAVYAFKRYAGTEFTASVALFTEKKFKEHHAIPDNVYFAPCSSSKAAPPPQPLLASSQMPMRKEAPEDPIAKLFHDEQGRQCNSGIPRVLCHDGDAYDPNRYDKDKGFHADSDPSAPLALSELPLIAPALSGAVRDDIREFMINTYGNGWMIEASRSLDEQELLDANNRLQDILNCSSRKDRNAFTAPVNKEAQKESKVLGALAAACVNRLSQEEARLQAKHGIGMNFSGSISDSTSEVSGQYIKSARTLMTAKQKMAFDAAIDGAGVAKMVGEFGIFFIPGYGQGYAMAKFLANVPLLGLGVSYAEKNKCAGVYPSSSPLFTECAASFTLMTQVASESMLLLRTFPALTDDGGVPGGLLGFQRADVQLPPDIKSLIDSYIPNQGAGSCVEQARLKLKGREEQLHYNASVFSPLLAQRRLMRLKASYCVSAQIRDPRMPLMTFSCPLS